MTNDKESKINNENMIDFYSKLSCSEIRQIARSKGIPHVTTYNKPVLINLLLKTKGQDVVVESSNKKKKGRPPKDCLFNLSKVYDLQNSFIIAKENEVLKSAIMQISDIIKSLSVK